MNLLFILPEYYPHSGGGISTYYIQYINSLKPYAKKIKVIVGSGYVQSDAHFFENGIEIESLKPAIYKKYLTKFKKYDLFPDFKRALASAWAMYFQAGEGAGFDLVECTDFGIGFIPWVLRHNLPVITRLHGSVGQVDLHESHKNSSLSTEVFRNAELLLLPLNDLLITHSKANQYFWQQTLSGKEVVQIDPIFENNLNTPLLFEERENCALVTARIQAWKGPIILCEALANLIAIDRPTIKWIGRDMPWNKNESFGQYLSARYPDIWNKSIVTSLPLPNYDILELQRKVRFGLIPSTWDMFNFSCIELLAAGTPVICSDGAGASELIEHGKNGFKYSAMDIVALSDCIRRVQLLNETEYNKLAFAAIETVKDHLSPARLLPKNIGEYQNVLMNFKSSSANSFLEKIYAPSDQEHSIGEILDTFPLKPLLAYVANRLGSKIARNKNT